MTARTLPKRVLGAIQRQGLWQPGQSVLLAVSGGLDSVVMLHLLAQHAGAHRGRLAVASVDHGLRTESAEEVAMVGEMADALSLPFHGIRVEVEPGPNLASRARDARRRALLELGMQRIATAHHQNDQAETVLFHLLRGAGTRGLRGMLPVDPPWCRPLLHESRDVLEAWARSCGLKWVEDPSNPLSQRGHLRRLMPLLDEVHGGASAALARSARILGREDVLLEELTDAAWASVCVDGRVSRHQLAGLPGALQLRVLRRLVGPAAATVRAVHLEAVVEGALRDAGHLQLGDGWCLVHEDGWLFLQGQA